MLLSKIKVAISILATFACCISAAETGGITLQLVDGELLKNINPIERKLSDSELDVLGMTIGKTNLTDVQNFFKQGTVYRQGDAGNTLYLLCYIGKNDTLLAFESGEMGGSEHVVSAVRLYKRSKDFKLFKECEKTSKLEKNIVLGNHLSLNQDPKSVVKKIGTPVKQTPNLILYYYSIEEATKTGSVDTTASIEVHMQKGKISFIAISKGESQ